MTFPERVVQLEHYLVDDIGQKSAMNVLSRFRGNLGSGLHPQSLRRQFLRVRFCVETLADMTHVEGGSFPKEFADGMIHETEDLQR